MIGIIFRMTRAAIALSICLSIVFAGTKAHQPMTAPDAPAGMTYRDFIADCIDAARTVEPARCGWGMMLSLAAVGPVYSVVYTAVGVNPGGFLAKVTAPDADIPRGVEGASLSEIPGIW